MERTQIYLSEDTRKALKALAERLGRSQSELIRAAVDQYLNRNQKATRLELLRQASGIWAERDDLPDFREIRTELDRINASRG